MQNNIAQLIGKLLIEQESTLSVAESCTGGRISHMLTVIPGASKYYLGSVTSYSASIKQKVLSVPEAMIRDFGVVSKEVAEAMAEGVKRLFGSDYSVATTGLAGPGGDGNLSEGTVWIAVSGPVKTISFCKQFDCGRARNIENFAISALEGLFQMIKEENS